MENIGSYIKKLRIEKGYSLRKVAAFLDVDQAILSKIEQGQRKLSKEQVIKLADFFNCDEKELLVTFFSDKILYEIGDEQYAIDALKVAEEKIKYRTFSKLDKNKIINHIKNKIKQFSKIRTAWIFGSFSRGEDSPQSDIDLVIEADDDFSYFDLAEVQYHLEKELNRKIDIGFISSFKPYILENIKPDLKLIYER